MPIDPSCLACGDCLLQVPPDAIDSVCINNTYLVSLLSLIHPTLGSTLLTYRICSCVPLNNVCHWVLEKCPDGPVPIDCESNGDECPIKLIDNSCTGGNLFPFPVLKIDDVVQGDAPVCRDFELFYDVFFDVEDLTELRVGIKDCECMNPNVEECPVGTILGPGRRNVKLTAKPTPTPTSIPTPTLTPTPIPIPSPFPEVNPQTCSQIMVEGNTKLIEPVLLSQPIQHQVMVEARIQKVYPGKVIIFGVLHKTINYTALDDQGNPFSKELKDDFPFQWFIDREDANENDPFYVTGSAILGELFAEPSNFSHHPVTGDQVAFGFVEKVIVKVCIRKGYAPA